MVVNSRSLQERPRGGQKVARQDVIQLRTFSTIKESAKGITGDGWGDLNGIERGWEMIQAIRDYGANRIGRQSIYLGDYTHGHETVRVDIPVREEWNIRYENFGCKNYWDMDTEG